MGKLSDYYSYYSFTRLLRTTKKYRELYKSEDAATAVVFSIITTTVIWFLFDNISSLSLNGLARNLLITLGAGLIGLLGFLISGLAILTGVISNRVVGKLDEQGKIDDLVEVLYSFYFEGGIIALTLFGFLTSYLLLHIEMEAIRWLYLCAAWLLSYLFWFSIIYAVGLIGTCINVFFINLCYTMDKDESDQR